MAKQNGILIKPQDNLISAIKSVLIDHTLLRSDFIIVQIYCASFRQTLRQSQQLFSSGLKSVEQVKCNALYYN